MYFAIIIPVILVAYLLMYHRKNTVWWEIILPFVVTIITIALCQYGAYKSAITDTEYLGHMVVKAVHEEPMDYDDECSEQYACGEDKDGNTEYCTRYYHCVSTKYRDTYFITDKGESIDINLDTYNKYEGLWEKYKYRTEQMVISSGGYTTKGDLYKRPGHGNKHEVFWNNKISNSVPVSRKATYDNYIQASKSLYNPRDISEREFTSYKLFDYPEGNGSDPILYSDGKPIYLMAQKQLQYANGWLNTTMGGFKKVRLWVLIYKNQPADIAEIQKVYWKNGNKNEFTIMLGVNDQYNLDWYDIMSWTEKEETKIIVRNYLADLQGKKLDTVTMHKLSLWLTDFIQKSYVKPSFEKYSYMTVPPSWTAIIISYIIVLLVCIGVGLFIICNEIDNPQGGIKWQKTN